MAVFGELALNNLPKYQTQALLCNLPHDAPSFINDDYLAMLNIVTAIDEDNLSPKRAKLQLLILATSMDQFKSNVVEGIADLLVKLPLDPIVDENQIGEVDMQTRFIDLLLLSMMAGTTRKAVLRRPNKKEDKLTTDIRSDAIVSALVQCTFGQSFGFGEVKLSGNKTSNRSFCLDTVKLVVLSHNSALEYGQPVLTFQLNGDELVF